jgi:1-acyl-sn-glycerol-3-phosphate acyltransferase
MSVIERIFRLLWLLVILSYRAARVSIKSIFIRKRKDFFFIEMQKWASEMVNAIGANVIVKGQENLVNGCSYVYIANHTNLLDIPVLACALPDKIHFMYRQSLEKIPMLGLALRSSPFIPIVRESASNSMHGIEKSLGILANGSGSIILFPEGTRSRSGEMTAFKRGAFVIASKTHKPIVPVTIFGVENVTPPEHQSHIQKANVYVNIGKPMDIPDFGDNRAEQNKFINLVRDMMIEQREKMKQASE